MGEHKHIKQLIWLYLALLIFEGALRKWVAPSLSTPLLIIRDPLVVLIYLLALRDGVFPQNGWIVSLIAMAMTSVVFSFLGGQTNLAVIAIGLRTNFLHPPLIWVMASVLTRKDVERLIIALVLVNIPSAALIVAQFRASPLDILNAGAGGDLGGQLDAGGGRVRPSSFFSFTTGVGNFLPLAAAAIYAQLYSRKKVWFWLLGISAAGLAVSLPASINRTAMLHTGIVIFVGAACQMRLGLFSPATLRLGAAVLAILIFMSVSPTFSDARSAFMNRWNDAASEDRGGVEAAVYGRILNGFIAPFQSLFRADFFGAGVGYGSNMSAALVAGGTGVFLLAEDEWSKCFLEMGPVLGLAFIGWRGALGLKLLLASFYQLTQRRNPTGMLLWTAGSIPLLQGQWGQPTALGFGVFISGLCFAACESDDEEEEEEDEEEDADDKSAEADDDEESSADDSDEDDGSSDEDDDDSDEEEEEEEEEEEDPDDDDEEEDKSSRHHRP